MIGIELQGYERIQRRFQAMRRAADENAMRTELEAGARMLAAETRRRAPVDTGRLLRSIGVSRGRRGRGKAVVSMIVNVPYAHPVEQGVRSGPRRRPGKYFVRAAKDLIGQRVAGRIAERMRRRIMR